MVTILNYSAPVNAEVPAGSAAAQGVAVTISWSPPTAQGTLLQFSACFGFFQEETHKFLLVMAWAAWGTRTAQTEQSWASGQDLFLDWNWKTHISNWACTDISHVSKSTSPCLWILSVWYSLRQSQGFGPRREKKQVQPLLSLGCFSVVPAVPVQVFRDWVSSQDKEGAGLEMLVKGDSHSSPSSCHWFQAWGLLGATAQPQPQALATHLLGFLSSLG